MIHPTAIIGSPPELRDWRPGDEMHHPDVHPTARVNAYVTVDAGSTRPTTIGARSWLLKGAYVAHDVLIGEDVEVAAHAVICGNVIILDGAKIGANATIRPGATIGEGARIGCGAVVTRDVPAGQVWAGNPARQLT